MSPAVNLISFVIVIDFAILLLCYIPNISSDDPIKLQNGNVLSRRKRYVAFPEGASLSVAMCMTQSLYDRAHIFTEGVNWGISYELPNKTTYLEAYENKFPNKHLIKRRHRRDLYHRMELVMNGMGFDGRNCIYKALCEAPRKLVPRGGTLIEEIIRLLFRFPLDELTDTEPEEHRMYHWAHRLGRELYSTEEECSKTFKNCPISVIDFATGLYSDPS